MDYDTALFAKSRDGRKSIRTADNGLQDKFSLPPIQFKIQSLMSSKFK